MQKNTFYSDEYRVEKGEMDQNMLDWAGALVRMMGSHGRVLDVGCGNGLITSYLGRKTGNKMYGLDLSRKNVEFCKARGIGARRGDAEARLPFSSSSFDGVLAIGIIEHLFDYHSFLDEVRRVTKPGGYLVLMTNNLGYWVNRVLVMMGKLPLDAQVEKGLQENQHIRYFTKRTISDLLKTHGFSVDSCFTRYPQIPFLVRYSRKLGNPHINASNFGHSLFVRAVKNGSWKKR